MATAAAAVILIITPFERRIFLQESEMRSEFFHGAGRAEATTTGERRQKGSPTPLRRRQI
jgi:hypothetical protein